LAPSLFLVAVLVFWTGSARAGNFTGLVVSVSDGDTLVVRHGAGTDKVRLYGIDCPERGQAFGRAARRFAVQAVARREVTVQVLDVDRYGRSVGLVAYAGGRLLNRELVRAGLAWVYARYCRVPMCREMREEEARARDQGLGLWADADPQPPWEFRHRAHGGDGEADAPARILRQLKRALGLL
jgi:endonuclease YncB( thermonuclease family)